MSIADPQALGLANDRFALADVFALQDEITRKVVAAIEPKLLEAEGVRRTVDRRRILVPGKW